MVVVFLYFALAYKFFNKITIKFRLISYPTYIKPNYDRKMKYFFGWTLITLIIIFLVIFALIYTVDSKVLKNNFAPTPTHSAYIISPTKVPTSSPTASYITPVSAISSTVSYCRPIQLQATITLIPGAGNIYGKFKIKNISSTSCAILTTKFIQVVYDTQKVTSVVVTDEGTNPASPLTIAAGQTIYSQVHYPNGPQCSGAPVLTPVKFKLPVSPGNSITFANTENNSTIQQVQTCKSANEVTNIEIWHLSTPPITS